MLADSRAGARIAYHSSGMRSRLVDIRTEAATMLESSSNNPKTVFVLPTSTTSNIAFTSAPRQPACCPNATKLRQFQIYLIAVSYTHLRAHETDSYLVC